MKGGLDQTALLQPRLPIVGQQTFPKNQAEHMIVRRVLVLVEVILLEDMAHPVRMKDQCPGSYECRNRDDISVALVHLQKEVECLAQKAERILSCGIPRWPRRVMSPLLLWERTLFSRK